MSEALINECFLDVSASYLFSKVADRVAGYRDSNPDASVISLGIGDVTRALSPAVCEAMRRAVEDMAHAGTFHGYGPEHGYMFLRRAIALHDYHARGVEIDEDEIFVNDGAKSDLGNIGDLFSRECRVAVTDPVYPVYVDTNLMGGRAGIELLPCTERNGFMPQLPQTRPSLIYLCYPNNPTGTVLGREELQKWVDYARETGAVILFDSAYEAYITTPDIPHSIYELEGAREVAIEFRSFSKTAGFTGLRCGYTVVPRSLMARDSRGGAHSLNGMWERRQSTKFNGASYVSQRAAEAVYSPQGQAYVVDTIASYMENARLLLAACGKAGLKAYGGKDAPYLWVKTPHGEDSWGFFDRLLHGLQLVCTPGSGFGACGEGFVRLTAFNTPEATREAARRIANFDFNK